MSSAKVMELINQFRESASLNDEKRDAGLPHVFKGVQRIDDLAYGPVSKWNLLDIYRPSEYQGKLPVMISIHGGGWCYGTKETYQYYGMGMAQRGFAFVNFNYQLAPTVHYPAQLEEVNRVMHWVVDHADQYDLDVNNVVLIGDSAGGQMMMQYLAAYINPDYRRQLGFKRPAMKIRAAANNCGASFLTLPGTLDGLPSAYFLPEIVKEKGQQLAYEQYLTKGLPPIFIATGNKDMIHDCSVRLDGYMLAKGLPHVFHNYGDKEHPAHHVFMISQKDPLAKKANDDEVAFLKKYLQN